MTSRGIAAGNSGNNATSATTAKQCGCGSVCWLCYDRNNSSSSVGGPGELTSQTHDSALQLPLSEIAAPPPAHHTIDSSSSRLEPSVTAQPAKSNAATSIRPLRSWSSSEKRGPSLEDPRRAGGPRRFSVAGPSAAAAAAASNSSAKSAAGSRKSHVLASLHTWAEEEDELGDGAMGPSFVHSQARNSRLLQQQGFMEYARTQSSRYTHHQQHSTGSINTSSRLQARRTMPESAFSFIDLGSSNGSSTGPLPSTLPTNTSSVGAPAGGRSGAGVPHHQRLRTPYSISIPSIIGSPLSFTQPFLATASRTSMYGRQPPSSQIRAAHIDWDSLSMAEELLGPSPPWGGGAVLPNSGNRNGAGCGGGAGDLPLWQQGAAIDHPPFVSSGSGFADKSAAHNVAGGRFGLPQKEVGSFGGPSAGMDHQSRLENYYHYQQYLLQSAAKQQQMLLQQQFLQQHKQNVAYQQQQQQQQKQYRSHHLLQQLQNQQQQQQQQQNEPYSEFSPGHMANSASVTAAAATVTAGMHSNSSNVGGLIQPHVAINEAYGAAMAQLTLASEFEKQMSWDYACQRHPLLSSFAVAAPLRLSLTWRWGLLCIVLASTGCVLIGTPVALMVLLAHQDTSFLAVNPF
ncbi:hypothetical protein IW140_001556 [Coemansia sp. RSA 1813]|nr:hypothetical protein EV179_001338 [Coemansia sp. RSA 487]KAJ2571376.1 hypothetical protein IW140_001556 [Coemansia sp. RSA 1813]